jgi:FkbM family methyltransferase
VNHKIEYLMNKTDEAITTLYSLSRKADEAIATLHNLSRKADEGKADEAIATLYSLGEKLDSLLVIENSDSQRQSFIREVDRLDGYVGYHIDKLRELIERKSSILCSSSNIDVIIKTGGFDLVVPAREAGLFSYFIGHNLNSVELAVREALRRLIKPGDTVVDGGTNIGAISVEMAYAIGEHGHFLGFEPLPHLVDAVRKTLGLNGLSKQSRVIQAALSDQKGDLTFYAADHSPISSMFERDGIKTSSVHVKSVTLDDAIGPDLRVDLVRLDIEGAEPQAWQGMSRILSQNQDLIVIMAWSASHFHRSGKDPSVFMTQILRSGFSAWRLIDEAPNQPVRIGLEDAASLEETNLLFSRNSGLYA